MAELLRLQSLSKSYGGLAVTRDVTLGVDDGEAVGIIGPNGAGKTTLFNLITGTVAPQLGAIRFLGEDISRRSAAERCRLGIARSFQVPQPFGGMTVYENVFAAGLFGARLTRAEAARRAMTILRDTELDAKATRVAGELTLLDRKRLELARALATGPKLLLLDEIAGGLTDHECVALIALVKSINRERGVTIVWIEHVVHALLAVVNRLIVLDAGQLVMDGEPRAVFESEEVVRLYTGGAHA